MKPGFGKIRIAGLLGFTLLWILAGCAQMRNVSERPRKGPAYYEHKVRWPGESLSIIAKWYTGSLENWKVLSKINPGIDPNRIQMGERVRIPENLLKTRKPMPENFVASFAQEKKGTGAPAPELKASKPKQKKIAPPKETKAKPAEKPAYYEHKVRWPGESLSIIAKWYTGSVENWKTLAKANPKINPSQIYLGQKVRIPRNLLKTREPMPKRFLSDAGKRKRKAAPSEPQPPPPTDDEEPQLFGPKPYPKKQSTSALPP
jgi:LysM repeat protein